MDVYPGHLDGTRVVHLTTRSFLLEAVCGVSVELDGEPDGAVICEECDALAAEAGGDPTLWVVLPRPDELRAAA